MANEEAGFLQAIADNPNDPNLPLVYADWLEEHGDPRGAWIRHRDVRPWMGPRFEDPVPALIDSLARRKRSLDVRRAVRGVGGPAVPGLAGLLQHEDRFIRLQAARCLRAIGPGAADALPALLAAVKDPDYKVREAVAKAIKDIGATPTTDTAALRDALTDEHYLVRQNAAQVLGSMQAKGSVVEELAARLDNPDSEARRQAVVALGNLHASTVVVPLGRALADPDATVRETAAAQFADSGWNLPGAVTPLRAALTDRSAVVRRHVLDALAKLGPEAAEAVPDLILNLTHKDGEMRWRAARALGAAKVQTPEVLDGLLNLTADGNEGICYAAVEALGTWERLPASVIPTLTNLFHRLRDPDTRGRVLGLFGRLETLTPAVLAELRSVLRGGDGSMAECAAHALGQFGPAAGEAIPDLVATLRRYKAPFAVAEALGRVGGEGIKHLGNLLTRKSESLQSAGVFGLKQAGPAALPALHQLRSHLRAHKADPKWLFIQEAVLAIRAVGPAGAEAIPELLDVLRSQGGHHKETAETLAQYGAALAPFLPRLVEMLRDPELWWLHPFLLQAVSALARHTPDVLTPLREPLRGETLAKSKLEKWQRGHYLMRARREALAGLALLGPAAAPAIADLIPLLQDPDRDVRRGAAVALGTTRATAAVSHLRPALCDGDEGVRARAAEALGRIGESGEETVVALVSVARDGSARVRRQAVEALGRLKANTPLVLATLRDAQQDTDKAVRTQAATALKRLTGSPT